MHRRKRLQDFLNVLTTSIKHDSIDKDTYHGSLMVEKVGTGSKTPCTTTISEIRQLSDKHHQQLKDNPPCDNTIDMSRKKAKKPSKTRRVVM